MQLKLGTRGSELAMTQSSWVANELYNKTFGEISTQLLKITTKGDINKIPLKELGVTGVFVNELRESLLNNDCDYLVHSFKDLPTQVDERFLIAATPIAADTRDCLCSREGCTLDELPPFSKVGTGSPRRIAQLLSKRPDLEIVPIRGNVDTRLKRLHEDLDAVVLAAAGLLRLNKKQFISEFFSLSEFPTSPAQGVLAIETLNNDDLATQLSVIDDPLTHARAFCERKVLSLLGSGCTDPVAISTVESRSNQNDQIATYDLVARVYSPQGTKFVSIIEPSLKNQDFIDSYETIANKVAIKLKEAGALDLLT